jgi:chromosome segregation protein
MLELAEQLASSEMLLEELQLSEEQVVERLEGVREQLQQATQAQQQAQGDLQRLGGRLASLEALQQAALEPGTGAADWLQDQGLEQQPRLAEGLRVEPGWELAVETVLGADLQAVLVDDFNDFDFAGLVQGDLRLLRPARWRVARQFAGQGRGRIDLSPWLGQVKPVEAWSRRWPSAGVGDGQSLISRDGYWVGRHFLRVRRASEAERCWPVARKSSAWARSKSRKRRWNNGNRCKTCARSSWSRKNGANTAPPQPGRSPPARRIESPVVGRQSQGRAG